MLMLQYFVILSCFVTPGSILEFDQLIPFTSLLEMFHLFTVRSIFQLLQRKRALMHMLLLLV